MSAATVLTSAMSGMPALSGTGGSLAALIRHIAPILGWSIEFDNSTDIIVIKPQSYGGGQALFYRFDDRAARGGAAPRVAEVRAYESMSDINTGAGLVGPVYISKSPTNDAVTRSWHVFGDAYGFYAGTHSANTTYPDGIPVNWHYFGFVNGVVNAVPICVMIGCGDLTGNVDYVISGMLYATSDSTGSLSYMYAHHNIEGTAKSVAVSPQIS